MEKHKPHYLLKVIQAQIDTLDAMNLTLSARAGIRAAGMAECLWVAGRSCFGYSGGE